MPEGDAVWRTARRLHDALAGDALVLSDVRWPSLATADLRGWTTVEVIPRGKHILHRLRSPQGATWTLHSHLRMDGTWRVAPARAKRPTGHRVRVLLGTTRVTAAGSSLGMLDLVPTGEERRLVGHLGPDLLGPDWDAARAVANLRADGGPLGPALLDQRHLAGIGTLWAAESLFAERRHPLTPVAELTDADLLALVERARVLMERSLVTGRGSEQNGPRAPVGGERYRPSPDRQGAGETFHAFARVGRPCHRCGTPIAQLDAGPRAQERGFSFCPACQPDKDRGGQVTLG
ncbi:hypothetical protein PCC79_14390 [Propioniciclava soli]|uniref:DNA-(apurinic or apyrimidinic site) lyase n=1 Tax=Propioniciclava soli TaxID=2775081 RepID=A0ABZ3C767_9ACTN